MTEKDIETAEDEAPVKIDPPSVSWAFTTFMRASLKQIEAKTVSCTNCPVFMLCETGQGGTGWVCPKCKMSGVYLDEPTDGGTTMPERVLAVDCAKHKFHVDKDCNQITECGVCSGGLMEFEVLNRGTKNYYIRTVHAIIPVAKRQETLKMAWDHWTKEYAEDKKKEKKEKK